MHNQNDKVYFSGQFTVLLVNSCVYSIVFFWQEKVFLESCWVGFWINLIIGEIGDTMFFRQNFLIQNKVSSKISTLSEDSICSVRHYIRFVHDVLLSCGNHLCSCCPDRDKWPDRIDFIMFDFCQ